MFKLLRGIVFITAALISTSSANADSAAMGTGVQSCAMFAEQYRASPSAVENLYLIWAQGFMSGLNFMAVFMGGAGRDLGSVPTNEQMLQLRNYCNTHPLALYMEGVTDVWVHFPLNKSLTK